MKDNTIFSSKSIFDQNKNIIDFHARQMRFLFFLSENCFSISKLTCVKKYKKLLFEILVKWQQLEQISKLLNDWWKSGNFRFFSFGLFDYRNNCNFGL